MIREQRQEASRRRILEVSADLFFEHGYSGTRVEMICERLGVTKPSVYWYYRGKTAIFDAVSLEAGRITLCSFSDLPADLGPARRLALGLWTCAANHVTHFKAGTLYYREPGGLSATARAEIERMSDRFYADLIGLLRHALAERVIPEQDVDVTAHAIGGIIGFMYVWYKPRGRLNPEDMTMELTRTMLRAAGASDVDELAEAVSRLALARPPASQASPDR